MRIFGTTSDGTEYIDSEFLLNAYCNGMFPMSDGKDGEIRWYSPDPRGIIPLDSLRISRSLSQTLKKNNFEIRVNSDFEGTIRHCSARKDVWISESIVQSYLRLHELGYAHSVECWKEESLVGGLYGVSINGAFFGESMFSAKTDASKVALVYLVQRLNENGYLLLDTQYGTPHLTTLGCIEITKEEYLQKLRTALEKKCIFI